MILTYKNIISFSIKEQQYHIYKVLEYNLFLEKGINEKIALKNKFICIKYIKIMYLCQHYTIKSIYHQIIKCEEVSELPQLNNTKKPI